MMPPKKWCPQHKNAKSIKKPGRNSGINPLLLPEQSQVRINVEQTQRLMDFLELTRLANKDFDTDDEMEEHEDDKEFYYVPPPSNSFPSLHAMLPAHTFYHEDSHSAVETLQWMPTELSLRMDSSSDNSEISLPMPGLSSRDTLPLSLGQPEQCCVNPGPSNREVPPSLCYGPPPRFDSQPEFPSLLYPSPPIFDGQPEQHFVTPGPSNREVAFPSLCYAPPPRFEDQPEQHATARLSNTFTSWHYAPSLIFDPPKYPEHYPPSNEPPIQSFVESLIPPSIQELEWPTTSIFKDTQQMQEHHEGRDRVWHSHRTHLDFPGICRVFVYEATCPMEGRQGQLIPTGVIRATNKTTVLALVPSSQILPPPLLPTMNTDTADRTSQLDHTRQPNLPQFLTTMDQTEVMKEAKQIMRRKVMLENVMPDTATNKAMARVALLEATKYLVPTTLLDTLAHIICHYEVSVKTICTITTTVRTVFKREACNAVLIPDHYGLSLLFSDVRSEANHRQDTVAPLLINQAYLFEDPSIWSPVNHPAVITTITCALWGSILHEALNFDNVNTLDNLFSIGGAAVGSSLMEYEDSGVQKTVQFAPSSQSSAEYGAIQLHNKVVHRTPDLHCASRALREVMVACRMSLWEIR
ncbi:hypothetical protein BD769DRAFT_1390681 [Suillus cothurnatus]|nr:hypothetical protein BD769DRAFT_1390681 [Suillus cothurnatus]